MKAKNIIESIVSFGAMVVIFGAWLKITHRPLADLFLTIGLLTECFIFGLYGVQYLFSKHKNETFQHGASQSQPLSHQFTTDKLSDSVNSLENTIKKIFNLN